VEKAILNAWPSVVVGDRNQWQSKLTLELTGLPEEIRFRALPDNAGTNTGLKPAHAAGFAAGLSALCKDAHRYRFTLQGVDLVMAEDDIVVADGLIKLVRVHPGRHTGPGNMSESLPQIHLDIFTEYPLPEQGDKLAVDIQQTPGLPATVTFSFSRKPLRDLLGGVRIGIDPGHGGKDKGIQGPVDLTEKYVALEISRELCNLLELSGAHLVVTRTGDLDVTEKERLHILRAGNPALCVEIHVSGSDNPLAQVYKLAATQDCSDSQLLGREIALALHERMGIRPESAVLPPRPGLEVPYVRVEPLCLTYFADEANFRAPLFRKRLAQSIYNGISRYLHKTKVRQS
jgi:N-acetylmuramoyl-L-alanine amidase